MRWIHPIEKLLAQAGAEVLLVSPSAPPRATELIFEAKPELFRVRRRASGAEALQLFVQSELGKVDY